MVKALDSRKRRARGDAVYEDKAFAIADPLVAQGSVFFLAGRVEDFEHARLAIYYDLLSVLVFNCRVVLYMRELWLVRDIWHVRFFFLAGIGNLLRASRGEGRGERRGFRIPRRG